MEKIHTKAVADVSSVLAVVLPQGMGTNDSLGGKVCRERAKGWRKICKLNIK